MLINMPTRIFPFTVHAFAPVCHPEEHSDRNGIHQQAEI
jgi:hypothetical protein